MDRYELLNSLLGPDSLGSIYDDTKPLLERNPNPFETKLNSSEKINKIEDVVVNKLYNNVKLVLKHIRPINQNTQAESSDKEVFSYINYSQNQVENTYACDKSLKKSVDVLLNPLLRLIVESGSYITTSCCSGRISFFEKDKYFQNKDNLIYGRSGRILYSSHSHISQESLDQIMACINSNPKHKNECYKREHEEENMEVCEESKLQLDHREVYTENEVILKFEAFLIHVECKNVEEATHLLNLCKSVGLKQSGISSCGKKIIMAIRGNSVLEAPIMIKKYKIENDVPHLLENQYLVSQEYLIQLINTCNQKMTLNVYQYLKLYHRLRREFKQNVNGSKGEADSDPDVGKISLNVANSCERRYIDIFKGGKLRFKDKFSFPFGVEKSVGVVSFSEETNYLLRTRCCMASTKEYVVLFGGCERSKTKTICVCDLKNVDRGFKVFDIGTNGPECIIDSNMVTDGNVFITYGGRKNISTFSNDVYLIYVYNKGDKNKINNNTGIDSSIGYDVNNDKGSFSSDDDNRNCNGSLEYKWYKCELKGTKIPKKRFRHSMCMEDKRNSQLNVDSNEDGDCDCDHGDDSSGFGSNSCYKARFYVSGGASSCEDIDNKLLGDIWVCTLRYRIEDDEIVRATVEWECLYEDTSLSWASGSIAHHGGSNTLFLIGGYRNLDKLIEGTGVMSTILGFDLKNKKILGYRMKPSRLLESSDDDSIIDYQNDEQKISNDCYYKDDFPVDTMSHGLVRMTDDDYLLVGGFGALAFRDEIWYLNIKECLWHKVFTLPRGTRSRFGSCLVRYQKGTCSHMELWLIGGGAPIMVIYGSVYDKPLRIIMYCSNKCNESLGECVEGSVGTVTSSEYGKYNYMGMYIVVENSSSLKQIKNMCEHKKVFDKSRKIVQYDKENKYIFHNYNCKDTGEFILCTRCKNNNRCRLCNCCSSCSNTEYSQLDSCFLIPILRYFEHTQIDTGSIFNLYSGAQTTSKVIQNPKQRLLTMFEYQGIKLDVTNVSFLGTALLITGGMDKSIDNVDWYVVSKQFKVDSVALVGEIEGEKRQRRVKLVYGNGDVSVNENGVVYNFNISTNMFSKGNSSERIRIVKTYLSVLNREGVKGKVGSKGELVVDFFCGIGYFSIPILKFTNEDVVSKVVCIDINEAAIRYIIKNTEANRIDKKRIETYNEDCSKFGTDFGKEYVDKADRILLGLLPNSEIGWIPALKALNKGDGGILHIHGLTQKKTDLKYREINTNKDWKVDVAEIPYTDEEYEKDVENVNNCEYFSLYTVRRFFELCKTLDFMKRCSWSLEVLWVQTVKHYSPHKYHQVVDLKLTPIL